MRYSEFKKLCYNIKTGKWAITPFKRHIISNGESDPISLLYDINEDMNNHYNKNKTSPGYKGATKAILNIRTYYEKNPPENLIQIQHEYRIDFLSEQYSLFKKYTPINKKSFINYIYKNFDLGLKKSSLKNLCYDKGIFDD